ncbi:MAG: RNA pseudouridine synthase, partial [Campylobacterales bacterium]|nr:RNA pseudouridine synthase [Campylobacterales bacterium]
DIYLKTMFEEKQYDKEYLAIVKGELKEDIKIDTPISKDGGLIGVKMTTKNPKGKESLTYIIPLEYNRDNNTTLVKAIPQTGRQHQIRVHLDSIGHTILGDPIYGIDEKIADKYLLKELSIEDRLHHTGSSRLMLHANSLSFRYKNIDYNIFSKQSL